MRRFRRFTLALLCGSLAASAHPQSGPEGALSGYVTDPSQVALPGVMVTAMNDGTGEVRTAHTNSEGLYRLSSLAVGRYTVSFALAGFKPASRSAVPVEAAVPRQVSVALEVGGLSEEISVTAEQPVIVTTTAAVSRQVSGLELAEVPSSTRNFTHLLTATAGVSSDLPPVQSNDAGSISPTVNGAKTTSNSVLYNGVDITSMLSNSGSLDEGLVPAPETIDEVKLQTALYDASTGRSGGGNFQLVTRSGANTVRGSLYAFGQHESLNANDFFFDKAGIEKPKAQRLESGFTVGGPLVRDKAFFFGSFQYTTAETGYVPTASSRALVPAALALIPGERTAENIVAAFRQLNPNFNLTPEQISPLALQLLNTRNPVTGGFLIPSAPGDVVRTDPRVNIGGGFGTIGGDPLVELRQVVPSEFQQYQASLRLDYLLSPNNRLSASYFYGDFPSLDQFPDPSTLVSPFTLRRSNRGQVAAVSNTSYFGGGAFNTVRVGLFTLRNTRTLDDPFLASDLTSAAFGIANPALAFDDTPGTRRLGHFVDRGATWSFGGPNDSANRREQRTLHLFDGYTRHFGSHQVSIGGELKLHDIKTNLPEEQATEFEKIENWQHFLLGLTPEADTQFGFTEKEFTARDLAFYVTDDWRVSPKLTLNLGLRWDWYAWPEEKNGYLGNFLLDRADPDNPITGLVVPANAGHTGDPSIDSAIQAAPRAATNHTLNGQDLDNFAPRVGFAWTPDDRGRFAVRGGYGIFYDRPSAAYMNTVFSNYPHLREVEITSPSRRVSIQNAFASYLPAPDFDGFFPFKVVYNPTSRSYTLFDGTGLGQAIGNPAETLEFRAVDPELKTPYYHHFNLGVQVEIAKNLGIELRYSGSRGRNLLISESLNIPWDLNDPRTPQAVFDRITAAYRAGGGQPSAADPEGLGYGYGGDKNRGPNGSVIGSEIRASYLGLNDREAVILKSDAESKYDALQVSLHRRWADGFQLHASYTLSKSMDYFSSDPGSTAGSGRPDEANSGFAAENDARDRAANWAPSDFDRRHRATLSGVWEPFKGWQLGAYFQYQSGRPFSVYAFEAGLNVLVFQRLDFAPGADASTASQQAPNPEDGWFNVDALQRATAAGNTPRNFLRGPSQKRLDLSLSKSFSFAAGRSLELRAELFNVFNWTNFALPQTNVASSDFGTITNTVGGPRTGQLGLRFVF